MQYNNWEVLGKSLRSGYLRCKCNLCGFERDISKYHLEHGNIPKCQCMKENYIGKRYGFWEVVGLGEDSLHLMCKCTKCGETVRQVRKDGLFSGRTQSCGCDQSDRRVRKLNIKNDLTDRTFGKWRVIQYEKAGRWICKCECGTIRSISSTDLMQGKTTSCGCAKADRYRSSMLERYGVENISQLDCGITFEQREILQNTERLKKFISSINPPRTIEKLSKALGVNSGSMWVYVRRHNLEELTDVCVAGSQYEDEIEAYLRELGVKYIKNDRNVLNGQEIDFYIPDRKFGVEFNGNYWHSELFKDTRYHQRKCLEATKNGIRLVQIFEYEWKDDLLRGKIKSLIKRAIVPEKNNIVYARNCNIITLDSDTSKRFQDEHHLMGSSPYKISIGLERNGELLGLMTFGIPRFNHNYECEMVRMVWKDGVVVVGGAEKLFKHFVENSPVKSIITYAELTKFSGEVYNRLGFKLDGITDPEYVWYNPTNKNLLNRYKTQKERLVANGLGDTGESEADIMLRNGYARIYDCGNMRYVWRREG